MFKIILGCFCLCLLLERVFPGWKLPQVKTWPVRVLAINAVQLAVVVLAGLTWERWFSQSSLFHLSHHVSAVAGGLMAYFIATFIFYWWHRLRHESDFLWLHFHQIHHSPQRLEVITSFYKHPLEMIVNSIIGTLLVYTCLGLSAEAGAIYTLCTAFGEFFYHTSCTTPRWVGYFFQRPEMHRIHHQYGYHKNNYGDIVWWDMLFGTYENPEKFESSCGFDDEKEQALFKMLAFKDIHAVIAALILGFSTPTYACSVFARSTPEQGAWVGKNFDWISNEGFMVLNPKGISKKSFYSSYPGAKTWTSLYTSLTFSPLGPGLPVSGMNDQGLVLETLIDHDAPANPRTQGKWASLEWGQYVLDQFGTLDEVLSFAQSSTFDQMTQSVHFFVCDAHASCGVIESSKNGKLRITAYSDLKKAVLANRSWKRDYEDSLNNQGRFSLSLPVSSSARFARLVRASERSRLSSANEVMEVLDSSKIGALVQWQIAWKPMTQEVYFRSYSGSRFLGLKYFERTPRPIQKIRIADLPQSSQVQVWNLSPNETQNWREGLVARMKKIMLLRTGRVDSQLIQRVERYSSQY